MTVRHDVLGFTDLDQHLFNEGTHFRLYEKLGAHLTEVDGVVGTRFAVWAPSARQLYVRGDFNGWDDVSCPLAPRGSSGVWEGFVPGVGHGSHYKYKIAPGGPGPWLDKTDPMAVLMEEPPRTASIVWDLGYDWGDDAWMAQRQGRHAHAEPMSIYEVHLGSWMRVPEEGNRSLGYREMAHRLGDYVTEMGYTHVELMPVMEHPFYGSWGYQVTGFFAPSRRFGDPQDFMYLVDHLHQRGIGVILDWVPSHFPVDEYALYRFDGSALYEHGDARKGFHPDWNSAIFDYGRKEVVCFLVSSGLFWLERYHADGLRVDAVASMLYLDYSRKEGEWIPNRYGGRENLDAVRFIQTLNAEAYRRCPGILTMAEESTSWRGVSRSTDQDGLGFGFKWDMGWMHDTLRYLARDMLFRKWHQDDLTFRMLYAWSENFVLSLSHDEVVYGKGSLLRKIPGDPWQKFATLRLLFGLQWTSPGKKLLFMGQDFAVWDEWDHEASLAWNLLEEAPHQGVQRFVQVLNRLLREKPALHALDHEAAGFEWIDCTDTEHSVISYLRFAADRSRPLMAVCNFTAEPHDSYEIGAPVGGTWRELVSSDDEAFGGSGITNGGAVQALEEGIHGQPYRLPLRLPPLGIVVLEPEEGPGG